MTVAWGSDHRSVSAKRREQWAGDKRNLVIAGFCHTVGRCRSVSGGREPEDGMPPPGPTVHGLGEHTVATNERSRGSSLLGEHIL